MNVRELSLPGVFLVEPKVFPDSRGYFFELWQAERYQGTQISGPFIQANAARSHKEVLRGLHYQLQHPQGKLVSVTQGEVFDVAVDIRQGSPTFGKWVGEVLSEYNHRQLFIPPGFAHGYCVVSASADFFYLCTDVYTPGDEYGLRWDDPRIGISWPISHPTLSAKDQEFSTLDALPSDQLPIFEGPQ